MTSYREQLIAAAEYVERRLGEPMRLREVARAAGLSEYHFQRIFRAAVGDSLKEYIRKRRLTVAARQLLQSDARILDLALEAGFESQQAFSRAFKRTYEQTPGRFRKNGQAKHARDRKRLTRDLLDHLTTRMTMEPQYRQRDAFHVVGLERHFDPESKTEIPKLWDQFMSRSDEIANRKGALSFGVCQGCETEGGDESRFSYATCVEVDSLEQIPEGMVGRTIEARDYAVFTHKGPVHEIHNTIDYIWGSWLPKSKVKAVSAPDFELYDERFHPVTGEFEIWVPIEEAD